MPMFGDKKFPYTPAGKKAAKAYAAGEKMEEDDNWFILPDIHMKFGGVDKVNPRGEIEY